MSFINYVNDVMVLRLIKYYVTHELTALSHINLSYITLMI